MSKLERGGGVVGGSALRVLALGLLIVLGVLAFNYWSVVVAHRATSERLTELTGTHDEVVQLKAELQKKLDVCSEQLKVAGDATQILRDKLKDSDRTNAGLEQQVRKLSYSLAAAQSDKTACEGQKQTEKQECVESSARQEESCRKSCEDKVRLAVTGAEEECMSRHRLHPPAPTAQ